MLRAILLWMSRAIYSLDVKGYSVDVQGYRVDVKGYHVDVKS